MKKANSISIILPVYNEENYIQIILNRVLKSNCLGLKKEIIVINDGSTDKSVSRIKYLVSTNEKTKLILINKRENEGKGAALRAGILKSTGDIVLIQDADLEYDPENYQKLLEPFIKYDADVVYGSRFVSQHPHRVLYFWHFLGNFFLTTLSNIFTNLNFTDMETGYKVFKGNLVRNIAPKLRSKRFGFEPEITAKIAKVKDIKIYEVGISYFGRTYSEGKKIGWKDGVKAILEIIKYKFVD